MCIGPKLRLSGETCKPGALKGVEKSGENLILSGIRLKMFKNYMLLIMVLLFYIILGLESKSLTLTEPKSIPFLGPPHVSAVGLKCVNDHEFIQL